MEKSLRHKLTVASVWILRILIGTVFVVSGTAKMIDPYGFIYKMEQYLAVWGWNIPDSLILVASVGISSVEFMAGLTLATGSYKRASVWILTAMMAGMLPLSIYIAVADPVDDCGCFGDFLIISNGLTCLKNVIITAALIWLLIYNRKVRGLYWPYLQWLQVAIGGIYIAIVGILGYHDQPLIDFRSYKVGMPLLADASEDADVKFVYERDGERCEFSADELPDSSWTYVDRVDPVSDERSLVLYDVDDDTDATDDVASEISTGDVMVLLVPDVQKAGVANTYIINELNSYMQSRGGALLALIGSDRDDTLEWMDMAMADYPVYLTEATAVKEIARGSMAVVYLRDGIILWKHTLWAIGADMFDEYLPSGGLDMRMTIHGPRRFWNLTAAATVALVILWIISRSAVGLRRRFWQKNKKKNVNLQQIGEAENSSSEMKTDKDFTNLDNKELQ